MQPPAEVLLRLFFFTLKPLLDASLSVPRSINDYIWKTIYSALSVGRQNSRVSLIDPWSNACLPLSLRCKVICEKSDPFQQGDFSGRPEWTCSHVLIQNGATAPLKRNNIFKVVLQQACNHPASNLILLKKKKKNHHICSICNTKDAPPTGDWIRFYIVSALLNVCLNLHKGSKHFSLFKHERWPSRTKCKDELHINDQWLHLANRGRLFFSLLVFHFCHRNSPWQLTASKIIVSNCQ